MRSIRSYTTGDAVFRLGLALTFIATLAACSSGGLRASDDSPFAPYSNGKRTVDNLELGHRLMAGREFELALKAFTRAAGEEGLTVEVLMGLGTAKLALGRLGQAEKDLRRAYDLEPENPAVLNNLGVVLMERGQTSEAEGLFRKAFALDNGESIEIRDNLRKALAKLDNQVYSDLEEEAFQVVRRGSSEYLITEYP